MSTDQPGWRPDPVHIGVARYFDGEDWTAWVAYGGRIARDTTPLTQVRRTAADAEARDYADHLRAAEQRGVVARDVVDRLLAELRREADERERSLVAAAASFGTGAVGLAAPPSPADRTSDGLEPPSPLSPSPVQRRPRPEPRPEPIPVVVEPGLVARWWGRTRTAVASDLAVHGLAYLGVLLLFAGVFGLVAFSFGDVDPVVRELAELLTPTACFVSAAYLARRRAVVVARALEFVGGAVLPVVAIASVTDGAGIPPDLTGHALPAVQGLSTLLLAAAYVVVVRRRPSSTLRYLAGPTAWLGLGLLSGVLRDTVVTGRQVVRPAPFQLAVVLVATAITVVWIRRRRGDSSVAADAADALARGVVVASVPAAVVAMVAEFGLAAGAGWPVASGVLVVLAALVLVEASSGSIGDRWVTVAQTALVIAGATRVSPDADIGWLAAASAAVLIVLAEWAARRRPTTIGAASVVIAAAAAVGVSAIAPWPGLTGAGTLTVWLLFRHARPAPVLPWRDEIGAAPAAAGVAVAVGVGRVLDLPIALVVLAATVAVVGVLGRFAPAVRARPLWRWWVPAAALAVAMATLGVPGSSDRGWVGLALALTALAVCCADGDAAARTWVVAGLLVWSGGNVAVAAAWSRPAVAVTLALVGLVAVLLGLRSTDRVPHHVAAIGHLVGVGAIATAPGLGVAAATAVGVWAIGWIALAVAVESTGERVATGETGQKTTGRATYVDRCRSWAAPLLQARLAWFDDVPALAGAVLVPVTAALVTDATTEVAIGDPWTGPVVALAAATVALVVRLVPWRRADRDPSAWVVTFTALTAVVVPTGEGAVDGWPMLVTLLTAMLALAALPTPRPPTTAWLVWAGFGGVSVLTVHLAGASHRWSDVTIAAWGAATLLGALAWDRHRAGPVGDGAPVRTAAAVAPSVLGAAAFVGGGAASIVDPSAVVAGSVLVGGGVTVLAVAWFLRLGTAGLVGWCGVVAGTTLLQPSHVWRDGWWYVGATVVLSVVAAVFRRSARGAARQRRDRWDLGAFAAAHVVGTAALVAAVSASDIAPQFTAIAALCVLVAVVLRRPVWAVAGALLALAAAVAEQHGWPSLALAVDGAALTVHAWRRRGLRRRAELVGGTVCWMLAWAAFVAWLDWSATTVLAVTVPATTLAAAAIALLIRTDHGPVDALVVWAVGLALTATAADVSVVAPSVDRTVGWSLVATGTAVLAVAAGLVSARAGEPLRWVTAVLVVAAGLAQGVALDPVPGATVAVGTAVASTIGLALVFGHGARPASPWVAPTLMVGVSAQAVGLGGAIVALPDRAGMIAVLLALAAEAAAFGVVRRSAAAMAVSPAMACAGWLTYAADALTGDPNWFTVPIGLALLGTSGGVRWVRGGRDAGDDVHAPDVVMLDVTGSFMLVAAASVQTLLGDLRYTLVVLGAGFGLVIWATVGRVRRRLALGVGTILLAVGLLLVVPLVQAVPTMSGPALWTTVAVIGLLIIVLATSLEQGRSRVHRLGEAWRDLTSGWE